ELLAATNRPIYLKKRIASDRGHLNNTQSAQYLQQLITQATQTIILAHLSLEANTHEQAQKIFEQYNADFTGTLQIAQPHDALAWTEIR
ncbi:MAG: MBL fold metallo-hydrolase, partial [Culicoidibacterales bacterium]